MAVSLKRALMEILTDWPDDLPPQWRNPCGGVELGFGNADLQLELEFWEPVFPVRRGGNFPGMPVGAHMSLAFEGIPPHRARCVILGQPPYPATDFVTGRTFEAGDLASWRELDKMFSKSVRAFIEQIVAARTGNSGYARDFADWPKRLADRERRGRVEARFSACAALGRRWRAAAQCRANTAPHPRLRRSASGARPFSPVVAMARAYPRAVARCFPARADRGAP
jgi:uracil-DNA glycosylase